MSDIKKRVVALQGIPLSITAPTTGQLLSYDGTEWAPSNLNLDPNSDGIIDIAATTIHSTDGLSGLTITSDTGPSGGNNGQISIISGTSSTSAGEPNNILLDSSGQNGEPNGQIFVMAGMGDNSSPSGSICMETVDGMTKGAASLAQFGIDCIQVHFNNTGLCFNQIVTVASAYTVNNGRINRYDYIVLGNTNAGSFSISLPPSANIGDTYIVGDAGHAATHNLTISGNGNNIDGSGSVVISVNYGTITVTYTDTYWKITSRS